MYPEQVTNIALKIFECMKEDLDDYEIKWSKKNSVPIIEQFLFPKFLSGEELTLTVKEALNLFNKIQCDLSIISLKEKGLVDTIEDEKNETIIFLTERGKKEAEYILKERNIIKK